MSPLNRRHFLQLTSLAAASGLIPAGLAAAADDSAALAEEAYIWAFPRVVMAEYLNNLAVQDFPQNQYVVSATLATPADKVPGPSLDLLYGLAWISLAKEPLVLSVPDAQDRYYSIQLVDVDANVFRYIGRRATGTRAGNYLIVGPGWNGSAPEGLTLIGAPSHQLWSLTRTFVADEVDRAVANAVEGQFGLTPLSQYPGNIVRAKLVDRIPFLPPIPKGAGLGLGYFDLLGDSLGADALRPEDRAALPRFASLGIGPGKHPSADTSHAAALAEGIKRADQRIRDYDPNTHANGWSVNLRVTEHIEDPLLKAAFNRLGPGGHIHKEALYFIPSGKPKTADAHGTAGAWGSIGPDGLPLSGERRYRLLFPAGKLPPVDAFWSLTLYEGTTWLLVDNPINRYALRDRTKGLAYGADGSLELLIQHDQPESGPSNWLPAPKGTFQLVLRTYQPHEELQNGSYTLPPLEIV
jgi:hypothetical protein